MPAALTLHSASKPPLITCFCLGKNVQFQWFLCWHPQILAGLLRCRLWKSPFLPLATRPTRCLLASSLAWPGGWSSVSHVSELRIQGSKHGATLGLQTLWCPCSRHWQGLLLVGPKGNFKCMHFLASLSRYTGMKLVTQETGLKINCKQGAQQSCNTVATLTIIIMHYEGFMDVLLWF